MFYRILHEIAWWANKHRIDWLTVLVYRVCCPYPIVDDWSARACIKAGLCGCSNKPKE